MAQTAFIDSHVHLYDRKFSNDLDDVLERAHNAGVQFFLVPGDSLETSREAVKLAIMYPDIYAAVGFHPHEAKDCTDDALDEIQRMAAEPRVVAIGEIGLDYHYNHSPRDIQRKIFRKHLQLARQLHLPVIIHCREAYTDLNNILSEGANKGVRGVCHCFSGTGEDARKLLDMGLYISFAGPVTYPKADNLRAIASEVPAERLLIETDAPYLTPQPKRGRRNEPAYVVYNAEKLAELHSLSIEDIARITTGNVQALFGFGEEAEQPTLAYELYDNLYINITNSCTNECAFCRRKSNPVMRDYDLHLKREPTADEIIEQIGDPSCYEEVVFCGFGEPLLKLSDVIKVASWLKANGARRIRINTNGQANLIHGRNIIPELIGLVDAFSISLNACNAEQYQELCHSRFGIQAYDAVKDFLRECVKHFDVTASVVAIDGFQVEEARKIVEQELGCKFRVRSLLRH